MSVFFIGCPHLGHRNIAVYRSFVKSSAENTQLIVSDWKRLVKKKDVVYVMGDAAFTIDGLNTIGDLPGRKILLKGNHDGFLSTAEQSEVFVEIHGMLKYKQMWLTHCPMHPGELFGKPNVHAHVHLNTPKLEGRVDPRYLNTCVDVLYPKYGKCMITLEEVREYFA